MKKIKVAKLTADELELHNALQAMNEQIKYCIWLNEQIRNAN